MPMLFARRSSVSVAIALLSSAASAQTYTATVFGPPEVAEVFLFGAGSGRQVGSLVSEAGTHAVVWTNASSLVDLHPAGADSSQALGVRGGQQVGTADFEGISQAALWNGTAQSFVSLAPPDFGYSAAYRTDGVTQVGAGRGPGTGRGPHALAWIGTAASVVDLHPADYTNSVALDVDGTRIVGHAIDLGGMPNAGYWTARDPLAWVSIHPTDGSFNATSAEAIGGSQIGGQGAGLATLGAKHALLWLNNGQGAPIDLHPATGGYSDSYVYAVHGGVQAGSVILSEFERAAVWAGTPESMTDLHDLVPGGPWSTSRVTGIDTDGTLYGYASAAGWSVPVRWTPAPLVCGPADVGGPGGAQGSDGTLNNNDFVVFIDLFFSHDPAADFGGTGGVPGADGAFDNNDFVVFIDRFFAGC